MTRFVLLDSGPLGEATHPKADRREPLRRWLSGLPSAGLHPLVPAIIDYEHRRKLLHLGSTNPVRRLDNLKRVFGYETLTPEALERAARLWAEARGQGRPTAPPDRLDIDAILAAQALELADREEGAIIATTNIKHLGRFADARDWREIGAETSGG